MAAEWVSAIAESARFFLSVFADRKKLEEEEIKEHIVPLHDALQRIHHGYVRMFNELKNDVRCIRFALADGKTTADESAIALRDRLQRFSEDRKDVEGFRDKFRNQIGAMVRVVEDKDLRNYLVAAAAYVINQDTRVSSKEFNHVRILVTSVLHGGGDQAFDTPSTALLRKLIDSKDPTEVEGMIDTALAALSLNLSSAFQYYYALRLRYH